MAFEFTSWGKVSVSFNLNAPNFFSYKSDIDDAATIGGTGYFDPVKNTLRVGDFIAAEPSGASDPRFLFVTQVDPAVITSIFLA